MNSELLHMTDAHTDELFPVTAAETSRIVFPISRLVCDVERFPTDDDEPMAARGMGVVYTRTSTGGVLRAPPSATGRQSVLDRWYWPHHSQLDRIVNEIVARFGRCLIIDCHGFASVPLPYEPVQTEHRPDFCIGTDSFHTPPAIRDVLVGAIEAEGHTVAVDAPFSGALVPLSVYRKDRRVSSVMIEVNRFLYMDERSGSRNSAFAEIRALIERFILAAARAAAPQ